MGLRYRKSIKIGKNTRINLSKSGAGISTGIKGARMSVGPHGVRQSVGIPGTGIYYTKEHRSRGKQVSAAINNSENQTTGTKQFGRKAFAILLFCVAIFLFLCGIPLLGPIGIFLWIMAAIIFYCGYKLFHTTKKENEATTSKFRQIDTKIVGVTFDNRQDVIKKCSSSMDILVVNTPSEKLPYTMGVYTLAADDDPTNFEQPRKTKDMLGYLNDKLAKELYDEEKLKFGAQSEVGPFPGEITEITGGTEEKPTLGCNIRITV